MLIFVLPTPKQREKVALLTAFLPTLTFRSMNGKALCWHNWSKPPGY